MQLPSSASFRPRSLPSASAHAVRRRSAGAPLAVLAVACLGWLGGLAGCRAPQAYAGERRPENEVAKLGIRYDVRGTEIWVERIGGRKVEVEGGSDVEILPGTCVLEGRARGFGQPKVGAPFRIEFLAMAGRDYALVLDQPNRSERLLISVEDLGRDETVASMELWP